MNGSEEGLKGISVQAGGFPTEKRRRRIGLWILVIVIMLVVAGLVLGGLSLLGLAFGRGELPLLEEHVMGDVTAPDKVAIIRAHGLISDEDLFGDNLLEKVTRQINRASKDKAVKVVILDVDSPGGSITASDVLHHRIEKLKQQKKVVALFGDMATSGAYYISSDADWIVAHPTTITGSIGVILQNINYEGLFQKIGLKSVTVKSGDKKDILSPARTMTPEEEAILQGIIEQLYGQFLNVVKEGRNLTDEKLSVMKDGRIITAKDALDKHLIDEIGYIENAVDAAKRLAKLTSVNVVRYKWAPGLMSILTGQTSSQSFPALGQIDRLLSIQGPRFMYLWLPGVAKD